MEKIKILSKVESRGKGNSKHMDSLNKGNPSFSLQDLSRVVSDKNFQKSPIHRVRRYLMAYTIAIISCPEGSIFH